MLTIAGLVGSYHVKHKADDINIDLWTGIGMLVFAVLMLLWAFSRPTVPEPTEHRGRGSGRLRRPRPDGLTAPRGRAVPRLRHAAMKDSGETYVIRP